MRMNFDMDRVEPTVADEIEAISGIAIGRKDKREVNRYIKGLAIEIAFRVRTGKPLFDIPIEQPTCKVCYEYMAQDSEHTCTQYDRDMMIGEDK